MLRQLVWMVIDGLHSKEPELFIDLRRVNEEDRRAHHVGLEDDVEYRNRVKKRMVEGLTAAQMAPLYNR